MKNLIIISYSKFLEIDKRLGVDFSGLSFSNQYVEANLFDGLVLIEECPSSINMDGSYQTTYNFIFKDQDSLLKFTMTYL